MSKKKLTAMGMTIWAVMGFSVSAFACPGENADQTAASAASLKDGLAMTGEAFFSGSMGENVSYMAAPGGGFSVTFPEGC